MRSKKRKLKEREEKERDVERTTNSCNSHADLSPLGACHLSTLLTTTHQTPALCMEHPAPKCWRNKSALTQTKLTPPFLHLCRFLSLSLYPTKLCCCLNCKQRRRCLNVLLGLLLSGSSGVLQREIRVSPDPYVLGNIILIIASTFFFARK